MNVRTQSTRGITTATFLLLVAAVTFAGETEENLLRGNPSSGRMLFESKECVRCHSVWGNGGTLGPDIVKAVEGKSVPRLAGEFWNHTPRMIEETHNRGYRWPELDSAEMADLLSYFYYLRLFGNPGDPVRGAVAFSRLRCANCHELAPEHSTSGGDLDRFAVYPSPLPLAQAMWNAGPSMQELQLDIDRSIPEFSGSEMADIQAFIRENGRRDRDEFQLLPLADPARGKTVFLSKRCNVCHGGEIGSAPDLGSSALKRSVAEIGGVLWNHSYAMHDQMRKRNIAFPRFEGQEMADVIGYIYLLGYVGEPGDETKGQALFSAKGCASCHSDEGAGPDIPEADVSGTIALSSAMWNHAPGMHELMAEQGTPWPKFEAGEMEDIVAFLRNRKETKE
jgi:cytochrome c2